MRAVVNAGGAWIDRVNAQLGLATAFMGGSKGSHLVIDNPALLAALGGHMVYFGTPDGRVNLLYPFFGKVLAGATDLPIRDPDAAFCDAAESRYLRAAIAEVFPGIPIAEEQVVYRFSGVRPLPRSDLGDIGSVTRDHSILTAALPGTDTPVFCLVGGKWTTFRAFAAEVSDQVLAHLGRARRVSTAGMPIGGGRDFPCGPAEREALAAELAGIGGVSAARANTLLSRYGSRARDYCQALAGRGERPLASLPDYAREELLHLSRTEWVVTVEDLLRRRTAIALTGNESAAVRDEVARLVGLPIAPPADTRAQTLYEAQL